MNAWITEIKKQKLAEIKEDELLSSYTTIKIGGPTPFLIIPNSLENATKIIKILHQNQVSFYPLGRGSNLLISDNGIKRPVLKLAHDVETLTINNNELYVEAGYPLIKLALSTKKLGLSGLEFAAGIPASVGGAIYMNAGAHSSNMANILKKALILFNDGEITWLSANELDFSYRHSLLQTKRPGVVLAAVFELQKADSELIKQKIQTYKNYRINTQPYDKPSAGSVFRNPLPLYAGKLIEELGLGGFSIGGAMISAVHCNFIVNENNATYNDVCQLIAYIKEKVANKFNVNLKTEIEFLIQ